jgi:NitT/TauT family transport system substrate-binding protein
MIHPAFRIPAIGLAVAGSLVISGCTSRSGAVAPVSVEKPDLTVAAVPSVDSAGLYIAQQRGLFRAQGLRVTIVAVRSSSTAVSGQMAGKYDVTVGGYVSYILAEALHHARLHILAAASMLRPASQEVVVPAGSPIQATAQLKGKTIAVNVLNNIGMLLVSSALADNGMSPSDVHFVPMPFPAMAAALKAHQVDAAYMPEPFITEAEMAVGAQPITDTDQGTTVNFPISGFVATQKWAQKYPRTAAAFRRAILTAQAIAGTSLAAVQRSMMAFASVSPAAAALMTPPEYPLSADPVLIQRVADLMLRFGLFRQLFDVRPMLR